MKKRSIASEREEEERQGIYKTVIIYTNESKLIMENVKMICTKEKDEKFTELKNMIIRAFNSSMDEIHKENEKPKPFRKYAPILTKLSCKLSDIAKKYEPYNMDDDYINCLNKWIEQEYEYMLIFMN